MSGGGGGGGGGALGYILMASLLPLQLYQGYYCVGGETMPSGHHVQNETPFKFK